MPSFVEFYRPTELVLHATEIGRTTWYGILRALRSGGIKIYVGDEWPEDVQVLAGVDVWRRSRVCR